MARTLTTITATVARVNGQGFQIQEQPGKWLNVSRYADPVPRIPPAGSEVELALDGSGFVREIRLAAQPADTPHPSQRDAKANCPPDNITTRLAALKAAAIFLATRPDAKAVDVLKVAEAFESWAAR
jgi:hypothetical protein